MEHNLTVEFDNGVSIGVGTPNRVLDFSGLESAETSGNIVENAIADGGYVASVRAGTRRVTFDVDFESSYRWADIGRLFPSGGTFDAVITRDGVTRRAVLRRVDPLEPLGNRGVLDPVSYQLPFVATTPYLLGDEVLLVSESGGGLEFPIEFDPDIVYDEFEDLDGATFPVENSGDHPVGFVLDMHVFVGGTMVLSVGAESMTISDLVGGERVVVDTARQTIRVNGANAFDRLLAGSFLKLPKGATVIDIAGVAGMVVVSFTPVFEGV